MGNDPTTKLKERLAAARNVVAVTGAGISAASGIPTYRSAGSGWDDPRLERISQANSYGMHLPELWEFWGKLRDLAAKAQPNLAHLALAGLERDLAAKGGSMLVATQNVDGLHTRTGSTTIELHGSVHRSRCMRCRKVFDDAEVPEPGDVPRCGCEGKLRLDVVLFGEQLASRDVKAVTKALRHCDLCLYVGTSGEVQPVSDLVATANAAGACCVLVNADPWARPHPGFHHTLIGPAETLLADLTAGTSAPGWA